MYAIAGKLAVHLGGNVMRQDTLHLTLAFVGEVSEERLPDLLQLGSEVAEEIRRLTTPALVPTLVPAFFELDRLNHWKHNRILWAGADRHPEILATLAGLLNGKLRASGYAIPLHNFSPHVTLIRRVKAVPQPAELEALKSAPVVWRYRGFALLRSRASSLGSAYESLGAWKLDANPEDADPVDPD